MPSTNPQKFAPSADLVPVRSVLPEHRPESGSIIIMRDGSYRMIIRTGAINFDMKSPIEQSGITYAFGAMVDGLDVDFPIQVVSHSKRLDIEAYIRQFEPRLMNERTPAPIRRLIQAHKGHFEDQVKTNNLLQRELYIVIPWKSTTGPLTRSFTDEIPFAALFKMVMKTTEARLTQHTPTDLDISTARQQLDLRADQITDRMMQMGIWSIRLDEEGVRRLLYELYHPALAERQKNPGSDSGGSFVGGFSSEGMPARRRRLSDDHILEPPKF
jgi:hypothetical protein